MGILESVIGNLISGPAGGATSPMGGILSSLLGGGQTGSAGMAGGLGGLLSQFQQAGLGNIAQSWVGNGPNQPVSPQQLQSVFDSDQIQNMANQAGIQPNDFLSQLAQHLPSAVDGMTPNGQVSSDGSMSV